jgi:hypothetical protein
MEGVSRSPTRTVIVSIRRCLLLLTVCTLAGTASAEGPVPAAYLRVPDPTLVPSREVLREQVKEPLFAFVLTMIAADSIGTWTAADFDAFATSWGAKSDFPLDHLRSISREVVPAESRRRHQGVEARRRLVITMQEDRLEFPMPYDILGYHPGTVVVESPLVFDEWSLGPRTIEAHADDGQSRRYVVDALTVFQCVGGATYLDVDAWLDTLLGDVVDDSWTVALVAGWEEDKLLGMGIATGRKGRRILGELNFKTGEIEVHDRPVVRGLATHVREWVTHPEIAGPRPWRDD